MKTILDISAPYRGWAFQSVEHVAWTKWWEWRMLNQEKDNPNMQTYTIEVKVDFVGSNKEQKENMIVQIMRTAAQQIHASALLLADQRKPQIAFYSNNFFEGIEEIMIHEDGTTTHEPEEALT